MQRIKPQKKYKLPGRLRKPGSPQSRRREAKLKEYAAGEMTQNQIPDFLKPLSIQAHRALEDLGITKQWGTVYNWLIERGRKKGPMRVLEIGCGTGGGLKDLKTTIKLNGVTAITHGIDVIPGRLVEKEVDHYIQGDTLRVDFPKSDFIYSDRALHYIGHPNVIVGKVVAALKPGGMALLSAPVHFCHEKHSHARFIEYFRMLAKKGWSKTPGISITATEWDRLTIMIRKADK